MWASIVKKELRYNRDFLIRKKVELFFEAKRLGNVLLACKRMGQKRSFYYYWFSRFARSGWDLKSLSERPRKPKSHPKTTSAKLVDAVRKIRLATGYGPLRIAYYLQKDFGMTLAKSTIGHILRREGLVKTRLKKPKKKHLLRYEMPTPGDVVQIDVKYVPERIRGEQYYQFTAIDDCTRWRYAEIFPEKSTHSTELFVERLLRVAPFKISVIQTDNGAEFTNVFVSDLRCVAKEPAEHVLDKICKREKIRHKLIPVATPQINGKVERSHRIDDEEFYRLKKHNDYNLLRTEFKAWIDKYNSVRPHGGIGMATQKEKLKEKMAA